MARKKHKSTKKRLLLALIIIAVIALVVTGLNLFTVQTLLKKANAYDKVEIESQFVPAKDENGNWYFTTDRDFRVMHLTDIHIGGGFLSKAVDEKALNAVAAMVTKEKPDLVIATGDITFAVPYRAGTFNNHSGIRAFADLMENLGVYWDVTLGNHDSEAYSYFDRAAVARFYEEDYKHCLFQTGPEEVDGYGNHTIEVKNLKGLITQALMLIDSQAYVKDNIIESIKCTYDNIHPNQVAWYASEINRMNEENRRIDKSAETVKSLAFFHIPLVEMDDAWNTFKNNDYRDTDDFHYTEGLIGELGRQVCCGYGEDDLFETMLSLGSTKAMFNGHDHVNNTTFTYKGITFSYGYSIDYFAYAGIDKLGSQRGCTMITCRPDSTFTMDKYNYYSDRYVLAGFTRENVTMQYADVTYQVIPE